MVIVDNGSTDNTEDIVMELCRTFPQVNGLRTNDPVSHPAAVQAGMAATSGAILLIQNADAPVSANAIRQLWQTRDDEELVFDRSEAAHLGSFVPVMHSQPTWSGGTQMVRREAVTELQESQTIRKPAVKIKRVTRTDLNESPSGPAIFQQLSNVESQQADR